MEELGPLSPTKFPKFSPAALKAQEIWTLGLPKFSKFLPYFKF